MNNLSKENQTNQKKSEIVQADIDLLMDPVQGKDTFSYNSQSQYETYDYEPQPMKGFITFAEGAYLFIDTREKLMSYLDTLILSMLTSPYMVKYRSLLSFYRFSPRSFLYLLAENCFTMLKQYRCGKWLEESTIYNGMMMMEESKHQLEVNRKKVNVRNLLQN